jgi:hypothetical protein
MTFRAATLPERNIELPRPDYGGIKQIGFASFFLFKIASLKVVVMGLILKRIGMVKPASIYKKK